MRCCTIPRMVSGTTLQSLVVNRDGDGQVINCSRDGTSHPYLVLLNQKKKVNDPQSGVGGNGPSAHNKDEAEVYTYVKHDIAKKKWTWHQEVNDKILPDSRSSCPDSPAPVGCLSGSRR